MPLIHYVGPSLVGFLESSPCCLKSLLWFRLSGVEGGTGQLGGGEGIWEPLEQGWANFSVKSQIGSILGFVDHAIRVTAFHSVAVVGKQPLANAKNGMACSSETLLTNADNGLGLARRCKLQELIEKMEQINWMGGIISPCISNHHDVPFKYFTIYLSIIHQ